MEQFFQNVHIEQDATLAIIAAILGVAFPVMVQAIGQIDTKYGSYILLFCSTACSGLGKIESFSG